MEQDDTAAFAEPAGPPAKRPKAAGKNGQGGRAVPKNQKPVQLHERLNRRKSKAKAVKAAKAKKTKGTKVLEHAKTIATKRTTRKGSKKGH